MDRLAHSDSLPFPLSTMKSQLAGRLRKWDIRPRRKPYHVPHLADEFWNISVYVLAWAEVSVHNKMALWWWRMSLCLRGHHSKFRSPWLASQIHREQDFGVNLYWPQHILWRLSLSLLKIECNNRTRNQDSTIFCCLEIPVGRHVALEVRKLGPEFQLYPSSQSICTVSIIIPHLRVAGWTEITSSHLWRDIVKERNFCSVFVLLSGAHQLRVEMNCSGWQKEFKEVIEVKGRKEKTTGREEEFGKSDGEFDLIFIVWYDLYLLPCICPKRFLVNTLWNWIRFGRWASDKKQRPLTRIQSSQGWLGAEAQKLRVPCSGLHSLRFWSQICLTPHLCSSL